MEPTTDTELEIPEALFKLLSEAAVANGRTMKEEIIARLHEHSMCIENENGGLEQQRRKKLKSVSREPGRSC